MSLRNPFRRTATASHGSAAHVPAGGDAPEAPRPAFPPALEYLLSDDQIRDRTALAGVAEAFRADGGTYHELNLRPDLRIPGDYDMRPYVDAYRIPDDLTGMTVLDVGTSAGYFALECARRGR
jgi:hypothetical protein